MSIPLISLTTGLLLEAASPTRYVAATHFLTDYLAEQQEACGVVDPTGDVITTIDQYNVGKHVSKTSKRSLLWAMEIAWPLHTINNAQMEGARALLSQMPLTGMFLKFLMDAKELHERPILCRDAIRAAYVAGDMCLTVVYHTKFYGKLARKEMDI